MLALENSERVRRAAATGYQRIQGIWFGHFDDIVARAAAKEREFGGGSYRFQGGPVFKAAVRFFGWRTALRARRVTRALRSPASGARS
jgi:hypothetical protein